MLHSLTVVVKAIWHWIHVFDESQDSPEASWTRIEMIPVRVRLPFENHESLRDSGH